MKAKTINRIGFISNNALRQVLVSLFNMVIPFMVIHYASKEVWGSFVSLLLFTLLALQVINWGNKEYLLRLFSQAPGKISSNYSQILFSRSPLILVFAVVGFFSFPQSFSFFILLWILGRFLNHSTEVLVIYEKKFNVAMAIELVCFAFFCICFYVLKPLDLYELLVIYSLYQLAKGLGYFILFRDFISTKNFMIDFSFYRNAFPFFLLSVLGFLASKVDVYIIERFGNKIITSDYQVINSLLVFTMSLSFFIYAPFTKNIYRNKAVMQKSQWFIAWAGLAVVPVSLIVISFVLQYYLHLSLPLLFYGIAFVYIYPSFVYGIKIVNLFSRHRENRVVFLLFLGAAANTILSAVFLYLGYGMTGALAGSAIAQVLVLILFCFNEK